CARCRRRRNKALRLSGPGVLRAQDRSTTSRLQCRCHGHPDQELLPSVALELHNRRVAPQSFNSAVRRYIDGVTPAEWLALIGVLLVWVVYRASQWSERDGVIRGLEAELNMHQGWVGGAYSEDDRGSWDADYMVYKLSTVAIDNAIARGPGLFINRDLT